MGVREERRAETTDLILSVARAHAAAHGAAGLSLRAVARDVGLAVSALYRYFPSRDDLLTALITEAYEECADAVEQAHRRVARRDPEARWTAMARAYRRWAHEHPSSFMLIFGTPVPGYHAPAERTFAAGTRIPQLLVTLLESAEPGSTGPALPRATRRRLSSLASGLGAPDLPPERLAAGIAAWDAVHGHVMFEVSGQFGDVRGDEALFAHVTAHAGRGAGVITSR